MKVLTIFGLASNQVYKKIQIKQCDINLTILELLRKYHVPIASSCIGLGLCKKCYVNGEQLACQLFVSEIIDLNTATEKELLITISYI